MKYKRLGEVLLTLGLLEEGMLKRALELQKASGERLGTILVKYGMLTEMQLIEALQVQLDVPFIDLSKEKVKPEMAAVVPKGIAMKHEVVPVRIEDGNLYLAMKDPMDFMAVEEVRTASGCGVIPMIANPDSVNRAIEELYGREGVARAIEEMKKSGSINEEREKGGSVLEVKEDSAPTIRLVNSFLNRAVKERASDIHLEPREHELVVRIRIDGVLHPILTVPGDLQLSVIARVKVIGGMNTTEHRIPQDGRATIKVQDQTIDLRISAIPVIHGEKVVIRLLNQSTALLTSQGIGLFGNDMEKYRKLLKTRSGVILLTGPTGSGKTSTMYTMIQELNRPGVNLVTLEDPVEYHIEGINQVPIYEKVGMTFAEGLRAVLRQDPDIIAVGEIRDRESAQIAMQAALTGHLVLSTIHTSDAITAIDRLRNIGVEPYLIADGIHGIMSQRLVRRICPNCKEAYVPGKEEREFLKINLESQVVLHRGRGCPHCFNTGYRGRIGVFEILIMGREVRTCIMEGKTREELLAAARKPGDMLLWDNCRKLVLEGITTTEEANVLAHSQFAK